MSATQGQARSRSGVASEDADSLQQTPLDDVLSRLSTSEKGLTADEAARRLQQYGRNEIAEKKTNPVLKFLSYFWSPIPWMIEAVLVLSIIAQKWTDAAVIAVLLAMNGGVAFWEEFQAGNAIDALKENLARQARVLRGGTWEVIDARELVIGDVIRLRLGDIVPADVRLLAEQSIQVDQSVLTGESLPVDRDKGGAVFSGSTVARGETDAVVYATAANTYFGRTATLVETAQNVSRFQRAILQIARYLIVVAVALIVITFVVGLLRHNDALTMLQFALVIGIASVPVALPAVLSVTMAAGAAALAKRQAVVTRLPAVQDVGTIDVLCADKTGTITQNKLEVGEPYVVDGARADGELSTSRDVLLAAALASRAENRDPIDAAVLGAWGNADELASFTIERFVPFDPVHKRTEATVVGPDAGRFRVTKGAPQVIFALTPDGAESSAAQRAVEEFASRGFRALAVARADEGDEWRLLGVLPLSDPAREDSAATIREANGLGIDVKMVTGDQLPIAREIARQVGLDTNIEDVAMLRSDGESAPSQRPGDQPGAGGRHGGQPEYDPDLVRAVENASGFAQVFPEDKERIVCLLQSGGHVVGMTGDGVNDAPALKQANAGIAVSGATDAARASADIVLLAPGLSVIAQAVRTSRKIFERMTSYTIYRIAETIRVLLLMSASILVLNFFPVTALMIVLLALLNDAAILSIAYDRATGSSRPAEWELRTILTVSSVLGGLGVIASFGLLYLAAVVWHLNHDLVQTLMYLKLSVAGHMTIFVTRTRGRLWSYRPATILLVAVLGTQVLATLIAVYGVLMHPLGWMLAGVVWVYAGVWLLVNDQVKVLVYRLLDLRRGEMGA